MASDIELFARLAKDILKDQTAQNTIPPEGLNAEKAGEKSEPDEIETPETEMEPPETTETEPPETKTETTTTTTTEKEN